eukprot:COSAG03_NODE_20105_length_324_cov_1.142222_1_plen_93_part_10
MEFFRALFDARNCGFRSVRDVARQTFPKTTALAVCLFATRELAVRFRVVVRVPAICGVGPIAGAFCRGQERLRTGRQQISHFAGAYQDLATQQ